MTERQPIQIDERTIVDKIGRSLAKTFKDTFNECGFYTFDSAKFFNTGPVTNENKISLETKARGVDVKGTAKQQFLNIDFEPINPSITKNEWHTITIDLTVSRAAGSFDSKLAELMGKKTLVGEMKRCITRAKNYSAIIKYRISEKGSVRVSVEELIPTGWCDAAKPFADMYDDDGNLMKTE